MNLDAGLMTILVCPICRSTLAVDDEASRLVCNACPRVYEVRDDIPMMQVADEPRTDADGRAQEAER